MNHPQTDNSRPRVLFLVQLPPPVHGVSVINQSVWGSSILDRSIDKRIVELDFADSIRSLRKFTISKVITFFRIRKQLVRELRIFKPDFVYFSLIPVGWGFWRDLLLVRVIRKAKITPVYHLHNRGIQQNIKSNFYRKLYKYVFEDSRVIHLSPKLLESELLSAGIKPKFSIAISNGIEEIDYEFPKVENANFSLLFVSNLFPDKGIFLLPGILKQLHRTYPEIRLRIVGEFMRKGYKTRLTKEIQRNNLQDKLIIAGGKIGKEKWQEYNQADIFIFPSIFKMECFPLVILEAMQAGLPVISSSIGGIPEIISHGQTGFLVEPGDTEGMIRHIIELYEDNERRAKMGMESRKQYLAKYTEDRMISEIASVFKIDQSQ